MAARTKLTKNLEEVEVKLLFGMTKRQLIFFIIGGVIGFIVYMITNPIIGLKLSLMLFTLIILPFFVIGFIKIDNIGLEKHLYNYLKRKNNSKFRVYKIKNNFRKIAKTTKNEERRENENHKKKQEKPNSKDV